MKTIILPSNINSKLNCETFIHITLAPDEPVNESAFPMLVTIKTKDNSYPEFNAQVVDFYRVNFNQLANLECWQSHGVSASAFRKLFPDQLHKSNPEFAVYFYCKLPNNGSQNIPTTDSQLIPQ